jgi:hypothetical protein
MRCPCTKEVRKPSEELNTIVTLGDAKRPRVRHNRPPVDDHERVNASVSRTGFAGNPG